MIICRFSVLRNICLTTLEKQLYCKIQNKNTIIIVFRAILQFCRITSNIIDDFRVSDAIFLGGANSGQTSKKSRDLACDAEPPL